MSVFRLLFRHVFETICGWVGYITVKALTFGKVELEWGYSSGSILTEWIGAGVLLGLAMLISLLIGHG
jgi:hypothetical protein